MRILSVLLLIVLLGSYACAQISHNDIIITEIFANADGADDNKEWFELYNTTDSQISLLNLQIVDNDDDSHTITTGLAIQPHGYLVLGQSTDSSLNGGAPVDYPYGTDITLGNNDDEIILLFNGIVIYSVAWGDYKTSPYSIDMDLPSSEPSKGESVGMNKTYYYGPVDSWKKQDTEFGTNGDKGNPGEDNERAFEPDMKDFADLAAFWLQSDCSVDNDWCDFSDINQDGTANIEDMHEIAKYWL